MNRKINAKLLAVLLSLVMVFAMTPMLASATGEEDAQASSEVTVESPAPADTEAAVEEETDSEQAVEPETVSEQEAEPDSESEQADEPETKSGQAAEPEAEDDPAPQELPEEVVSEEAPVAEPAADENAQDEAMLAVPQEQTESSVAKIGDTYYDSLQEAVAAANAGDTIVMVGDEELTGSVSIKKNLTIDLNGHTISANFSGPAIVLPFDQDPTMKEVTITDTSEGGNGKISNAGSNGRAVDVEAYGTLNVEGGTLHGSGAGINQVSWSNCTVNLKDGNVEGGPYGIRTNGTTNIEGGKVHGYNSGIMADRATPGPKVKISGGEVSSDDTSEMYVGVRMNNGDLLVTGGTIYGNVGILVNGHTFGSTTYTPTAEVNGGTIKGSTRSISNENSAGEVDPSRFLIGGGKYSDATGNGDAYARPEGKILLDDDNDGLYELATPVAKRVVDGEDVLYGTLQKAFNAAEDGDTVYVIADITLTERAAIRGKTVTLDLGEYTITNDDSFDTSGFGESLIFVSHGEGSDAGLILTGDGGKLVSTNGMAVWLESGTRPADGYANFTMDTVTIEADTCAVYTNGNESRITVNSGTIHSAKNGPTGDSSGAIYAGGRSTVTINGGTITNDEGTALSVNSPTVTVNGGTLTGGTYGINMVSTATGSVTVEDGVISGASASVKAATPSRFTINGGVYSDGAGNADGYVRKDGMMLIKGANGEYPDMFALGAAVASIERDGKINCYATLADAVADAQAGETIKMIDNEALTGSVSIRKNVTIDLNGHEISADFNGAAIVLPFAFDPTMKEVTITDTSEDGNGAISNTNSRGRAVDVEAYGTLNVEGGTLHGGNAGIEQTSWSNCTVNVKDGTVEGGAYGIRTVGTLTNIEGGKIHGYNSGIVTDRGTPGAKVSISGGEVSSDDTSAMYAGVRLNDGELEVTGGSIYGNVGILVNGHVFGSSTYTPSVTVSGGEIAGSTRSVSNENSDGDVDPSRFTINGGKYSDDIGNSDDYTRPEYMTLLDEDGDGWYELSLGGAVAVIERDGETLFYETLAAAVEDARAGETVKMIDDEELTGPVSIKKNLTIDLNGHEVSANFGGGAIIIPWGDGATTKKEVTITDTSDAGNGAIRNETGYAVEPQAYATLNVKGGELYGYGAGINAPSSYATINVQGGTVEGHQSGINVTGGDVTVTGGTIHGDFGGIIGGLGGPAPDIKVSGGSISSSESHENYRGIFLRGGKLEMTGGTVSGGTGILVESFNWGSSDQISAAEVSGGTVTGAVNSVDIQDSDGIKSEFKISGGKYSDDIGNGDDYTRPPHQHLQKDGDYYVLKIDPRTEVTVEIGEGHDAVAEGWAEYLNGNMEDIDLDIDEISADGTTITLYCYDKSKTVGELQQDLAELLNDYMGSTDDMPGPRPGEHNKELIYGLGALGQKPFDQYSGFNDITEEIEASTDAIPDEQTYYALWEKPVTSIEITVETELCGTEVTAADSSDREGQSPKPVVSIDSEGAKLADDYEPYWTSSKENVRDNVFSGKLTGGEGAIVRIMVAREFGYYINGAYLESITVNGKEVAASDIVGSSVAMRDFYADIDVDHDPDDPVQEKLVEPTASEPGSYDEVVYCKGCGEELSRETITIPAVTYEVTEGDGSTWTRGSGEDLNFTVERSYKDEETFERYQEIKVDGETVDPANYEAEAGSLKVALKADYLETLENGEHTLTAVFDDGEADAAFTIAEEESGDDETPVDPDDEDQDEDPGDGDDQDEEPGDGDDQDEGDEGTVDPDDSDTSGADEDGSAADEESEADSPKTGDLSGSLSLYVLLFCVSGVILAAFRRRSVKQ